MMNYTELPDRIIRENPFLGKPLTSYGIIAYCLETQEWLLVKRRHSPSFIIIVRGSYRKADLPGLMPGLTQGEIRQFGFVLTHHAPFENLFYATISSSEKDMQYGQLRFEENAGRLRELLSQTTGCPDTEWLWPKGRTHGQNENVFHCALREFSEETGLHLKLPFRVTPPDQWNNGSELAYLASTDQLRESIQGVSGKVYETRCWVVVFPKKVYPPPILDLHEPGEIGDVRWMSAIECRACLMEHKYRLLEEAQTLLDQAQLTASVLRCSSEDDTTSSPEPGDSQDSSSSDEWCVVSNKHRNK